MGSVYDEFKTIIKEQIREDQFKSYKSIREKGDEKFPWLKSVCSFLNNYGGKLYLGLAEIDHLPSEVLPIQGMDRDGLSRHITGRIDPSVDGRLFEISEESVEENDKKGKIFIINVKTSQTRPHAYNGRFYWRRDDEDAYMNVAQIERKIIEARAEELMFEELRHNANLARKIFEATQPVHADKIACACGIAFSFRRLQTMAWIYLWEHGLITMVGEDFGDLRNIYYETQHVNEIIDLLKSGCRIMYDEEEKGSYGTVNKLKSKVDTLRARIDDFLRKKGKPPT